MSVETLSAAAWLIPAFVWTINALIYEGWFRWISIAVAIMCLCFLKSHL